MQANNRIVSGMRPTGPLHLGHYFGVLLNWEKMQRENECFFFVADWHALTTDYADPSRIKEFVPELVMDWLAAGLDPEKCVLFQQSMVKEHAELHLLLSMITPVGWLERNPTYKEVRQESSKDLSTYGFLGYPVLQAADIVIYRPRYVPVGHDQLPHLELSREIVRRFNHFYGEFFPEPEAKLTTSAKLPGLDGRKMSKSYGNAIHLKDSMDEIRPKVMSMLTDTKRQRLKDPGEPEDCNLYPYLELLEGTELLDEVQEGCRAATRGCGDCKKLLAQRLAEFLEPIQARRAQYERDPDLLADVLKQGTDRAREEAQATMERVRELIGFNF
ncbi:tryptophan--tRNA ligase [Desulfohalovibrio reitneri]|uniref:tryptophan--tRNA ligase n=1 Tax=Desulfohalovibrio reitneri TaxID=1307759 RepID=UPI0004A74B6D|nr:tryptophan--tRNA ligase [Desulfohalovibrio reitneri]